MHTRAKVPLLASIAVAGICAVLLTATSSGLPMVWDEGNAIHRAEGIWQGEWQYTTHVEGHPALYGIVIAAGQRFARGWLLPLDAARFGPMMLFAVAAGAMFYRVWREYSATAAVGAVTALLLLPRMFAHAHFASFDGPLTSCWILAWATFAPAVRNWRWAVVWGIALGMTLSCKATGWIAPVPFVLWAVAYRDRAAGKALAVGLPVAVATFFALNPPLWQVPLAGWITFFQLNLNRAANPGLNISTWFLGRMYNLDYPLPWYNTLFWTAVTVPVGILLLAIVGVGSTLRSRGRHAAGTLILANWLVLLIVRAIPGTPPHDGVRQFLPSFAFLAVLAGVGSAAVLGWAAGRWANNVRARVATAAAVVLIFAGSASSLAWYAPQWLSYYNLLIGGLPGATAAGMEPTYYWDGLDRSVVDWLHENTAKDEAIRFGASSAENLELLRQWEVIRRPAGVDVPEHFRWYVMQRRPSGYRPVDSWLIKNETPAYQKRIHGTGIGPWRLDVPLVEVYSHEQYQRARFSPG
ncbi:MAG: 4-amino-4-deoxy-L-arabinose transferase [Candidatus Nealsonbacteria bacterium]|nr:4-amino-4-deoxy-L-arabinose transferase [Candidatus Nealsonbacteria bacterium]